MKNQSKSTLSVVLIALFVIALFNAPSDVKAQWHDKSDETMKELGAVSTETLVLVGVACVAAVFIIKKISDDRKKAEVETKEDDKQHEVSNISDATRLLTPSRNLGKDLNKALRAKGKVSYSLYCAMRDNDGTNITLNSIDSDVSNKTYLMGLSLSF